MEALTPTQVDDRAKLYLELKDKLLSAMFAAREAQKPVDQAKEELVNLVRAFGSAHAEKSKILHGIVYEIMATFGSYTSLDAAAIEAFRLALVKAKQSRLLKKIFTKDVRWSLSPEAAEIIRGEKKLSKPLLALYSKCQVLKARSPSIDVREKRRA